MKILLFLLLGAILNVAVAWGCFLYASNDGAGATQRRMEPPSDSEREWIMSHGHQPAQEKPVSQVICFGIEARKYLLQRPKWARSIEEAGISVGLPFEPSVCRVSAGFPTKALNEELWRYYNDTNARAQPQHEMFWGLDGPGRGYCLPLRPIFPGFAINTIFYAAVLWVPCALIGVMRRRRRIKRGMCPDCGYDLRGRGSDSKTCPECGSSAAVKTA